MTRPTSIDVAHRFGAHMGTAGGLHNAVLSGKEVGCDLVQLFTKNPQQWREPEITDEQVEELRRAQEETGIRAIASHDTYLINPVSPDPELLSKSRQALIAEMQRSSRLGIPLVVMHLGTPGPVEGNEGLDRLVESVRQALEASPDDGSTLLLETMAGQGKCLGHRFEDLGYVFEKLGDHPRLGVCLDTCHIFAAGYDIRTPESVAETLAEFDRVVGLDRIRLIHANDSKKELGSRVDRHEAIGAGCIGEAGFAALLGDPRLRSVPVLLETPKAGDMDPVNLAAIRRAAG